MLNVAWLGLGTVRLFVEKWAADVAMEVVLVASAYAAYRIGVTHLVAGALHALRVQRLPAPKAIMPGSVRILARWFSIGSFRRTFASFIVDSIVSMRPGTYSLAGNSSVLIGMRGYASLSGR